MKYINRNIPTTGQASSIKKVDLGTSHHRATPSQRFREVTRPKITHQMRGSRIIGQAMPGPGIEVGEQDSNLVPMVMPSSRDIAHITTIIPVKEDNGMCRPGQDHSHVSGGQWDGYSSLYSSSL